MTDKKTGKKIRKEINAVIQKYLGKSNDHTFLKSFSILGGTAAGLGIGMDLLLTGGLFSMGTIVLGGAGTFMAATGGGLLLRNSKKKSRTNAAGQTFQCIEQINDALGEMERRLKKSFNAAALFYASQDDKKSFQLLAAEIGQDVRKLSPAFKIVSGKPRDRYEFVVAEVPAPDGQKKLLTLTEALQHMNLAPLLEKQPGSENPARPKKPTPKNDTQNLKARLEAIENPRKPPSP